MVWFIKNNALMVDGNSNVLYSRYGPSMVDIRYWMVPGMWCCSGMYASVFDGGWSGVQVQFDNRRHVRNVSGVAHRQFKDSSTINRPRV